MDDINQELTAPEDDIAQENHDNASRRISWRWLIGCVVAVAVIALGVSQIPEGHDKQTYTHQFTQAKKAIAQQKEKDTALKARLKEAVKPITQPVAIPSVDVSKTSPASSPPVAPAQPIPDDAQAQFIELQEKLRAQHAEIEALHTEIGTMQQRATHQHLLWSSYLAIKQHIAAGEPFIDTLRPLIQQRDAFPEDIAGAITQLQPYARQKIVDNATLSTLFAQSVTEYYQHHPLHGMGGAGAESGIAAWIGGLIEIRKTGTHHTGDDDAARLARAEVALQQRDISAALQEVRSLSVKATPFFKAWRAKAYAQQEVRRVMRTFAQALKKER